jgi:fluoroacetyl-CoA thioesterase
MYLDMKDLFNKGDIKIYSKTVEQDDTATFDSGQVHPVYATFALGRDAEWVCRLFVIDMKEADEEGIGTFIHVNHHSPALIGNTVNFKATFERLEGNHVICNFEAKIGDRLVASGQTGQKILKKEKLERLFSSLH